VDADSGDFCLSVRIVSRLIIVAIVVSIIVGQSLSRSLSRSSSIPYTDRVVENDAPYTKYEDIRENRKDQRRKVNS